MKLNRETADKILAADFTNIMKKVKAGKPLSSAEREIVKQHAAESEKAAATTPTAPPKKPGKKGKKQKLGIALNMEAAASRTELPRELVEAARNQGCTAFHQSGRIDCDALLDYVAAHPDLIPKKDPNADAPNILLEEARLKRVNRQIREEKLLEIRRKVITKSEAGQRLFALGQKQKAIIEGEFKKHPELVARFCKLMRELVQEWQEL